MPSGPQSPRGQWLSDGSASVAVEFSLVAPVILALLLGGVDACRALIAYRNLQQLAASAAWSAKVQVTPANATRPAALPPSATVTLENTLLVTYGATRSDVALSVRYLVKPVGVAPMSDSTLYSAGAAVGANNAGIDTNMKPGDTRIVVQASRRFKYLFGAGSLQLTARSSL